MAIFLSLQGRRLNEVRSEIKMCFSMTSSSNKCPLVGVIGLFNKRVTLLEFLLLNRIKGIRSNPLKPCSHKIVLFCNDLGGHLFAENVNCSTKYKVYYSAIHSGIMHTKKYINRFYCNIKKQKLYIFIFHIQSENL